MTLDAVERTVRIAGLVVLAVGWFEAGRGIASGVDRARGPASGLAARIGVVPAYLVIAVPYFAICALLWRPLPLGLPDAARIAALVIGFPLGLAGAGLYLWGRWTLGSMYNVTGTLGAQLYAGHRLVTEGPYRRVRHPMYAGIVLGAVGGLIVFRTWTFVFVSLSLPGVARRSRHEDRLLAEAFGDAFETYRRSVPAWFPGSTRRSSPVRAGRRSPTGSEGSVRRFLEPNSTPPGRLVRGLLVAPTAGWITMGTSLPMSVRIPAGVVMVLSVVSAVSGHCFVHDLVGLVRSGRPQSR